MVKKTNIIKQVFSIVLLALVALVCIGCGGDTAYRQDKIDTFEQLVKTSKKQSRVLDASSVSTLRKMTGWYKKQLSPLYPHCNEEQQIKIDTLVVMSHSFIKERKRIIIKSVAERHKEDSLAYQKISKIYDTKDIHDSSLDGVRTYFYPNEWENLACLLKYSTLVDEKPMKK